MAKGTSYVTQQQVAARAGVHQTTVSLVFRDHPSVPAATRKKVMTAARELGYQRHPLLSALMSVRLRLTPGESGPVLGFLTDFDRRDRWKESPTAMEMFAGARARAQELGFRLEVFWLRDPEISPTRLANILKARNIHGLLLAPTHEPIGLTRFDFQPFAAVGLGVSHETSALLSVAHDHFNGMRTALEQVARAGRKRVGIVLTVAANEMVRARWLGAHALASGAGDQPASMPVWLGPLDPARFKSWLRQHRPDALVGTFDGELREMLQKNRYRVPRDIALISLSLMPDDSSQAGIYQRSRIIGERAVDLVVGALNHNQRGLLPMHQVLHIDGEWRPGPSLETAR